MFEMTSRERLKSAILGEGVDRIPFSPFLAYFWEAQPREIQEKGQLAFLLEMGADPLMRGCCTLVDIKTPHCTFEGNASNGLMYHKYITPIGTIETKYTLSEVAKSWFVTDHAIKTAEDCKILKYYYDDMQLEPNYKAYNDIVKTHGENAFELPNFNAFGKTAFQYLIEHWVGIENLTYLLLDDEDIVLQLLDSMMAMNRKSVLLSMDSKAPLFNTWEDSSSLLTSPNMYERFILPEIEDWCNILKQNGQGLVQHACGHLKNLSPIIAKSSITGIESMSPPPTGDIEMADLRKILPKRISMIGGIEPTKLLNFDEIQLTEYVLSLLNDLKGTGFVLGNSDSCPPNVSYSSFLTIARIAKNYRLV